MRFSFRIFFVLLSMSCPALLQGQPFSTIKDLNKELLKFEEGEYKKMVDGEKVRIAYVLLRPSEYSGEFLHVKSDEYFSLFINGRLAAVTQLNSKYNIDSLRTQFGSPQLLVGIHQQDPGGRVVEILSRQKAVTPDVFFRPATALRDFSVVAILSLLILFTVLIRLNPKLVADYFSLVRIFSIRELEDNQVYTRITSSSNILFYIFCSLMMGFSVMVIFEFTSVSGGHVDNFGRVLLNWLAVSFVVLLLFFAKIILVYLLSILFGIKGVRGVHVFYWIRVLVVTGSIITTLVFIYFITRGHNAAVYEVMRWSITATLVSLIVLIFLKLMRRAECSIFHLFSYICATEIIPFLITIKLLYQ